MNKRQIRNEAFNFLGTFGDNIKTKFSNICSKTGRYNVPEELFQKRTPRKNRVLISWKTVKANNLSLTQLQSFKNGIVVEFINEDYFSEETENIELFNYLKHHIGSDETVSAIITIRSETGSSSSAIQRKYFNQLINDTEVLYKDKVIKINNQNYQDYAIHRTSSGGKGNNNWTGFLFVCIKGGQQDTLETHKGTEEKLFNPACEYASENVGLDMDLVMAYFAFKSIEIQSYPKEQQILYDKILSNISSTLKNCMYDSASYKGNLLDYCINHPCLKFMEDKLCDPIQVLPIYIADFSIKDKEDSKNLDFTHNEAVNKEIYYWDDAQKCVLSPARPTNVFWSKHLSNMMQQNYTLQEYFDKEKERVERRQKFIK